MQPRSPKLLEDIRDAAAFMQGHLSDIETEVYERDVER